MNVIKTSFSLVSFFVVILGAFVNWFDKYTPSIILKIYKYGKFSYDGAVPFTIQVPKRWFRHFYVLAVVLAVSGFTILTAIDFKLLTSLPSNVRIVLSWLGTQTETVPAIRSLLAMTLLMIQCCRRFYETHFVSVFSDSKMDIGHYLLGHMHYIGCVLSIICEAPGTISGKNPEIVFSDIGIITVVATMIFLWACRNQLSCAQILANLRKNENGQVVTTKHKVPHGDYFELVSSPHSFFEIVMYISLWVILKENTSWPYVVMWVVANQIETSLLAHWWYKKTFKNYPKQRKCIIPYIM